MKVLWVVQKYLGGLRECTFIDRAPREQSSFLATDEQAHEFATEVGTVITVARLYWK